MSKLGKYRDKESRLVVARGWGRGEWRVTVNEYRAFFFSFWRGNMMKTPGISHWLDNFVNTLKTTESHTLNTKIISMPFIPV